MNIKEAYAKAAPGPLTAVSHEIMAGRNGKHRTIVFCYADDPPGTELDVNAEHNAALLAHAYNVLPEVLEAIDDALEELRNGHTYEASEALEQVIAKASEVKV